MPPDGFDPQAFEAARLARSRHGCDDPIEIRYERAKGALRRFRSIRRGWINRDNVEHTELGGEG